jgi:hypothetical protein
MTTGEDQVFGFRGAIERNRATFALQHAFAFHAFFGLCECLDRAGRRLQTGRNVDGKSLVSLIPFLALAQRQAMNAFEAFATFRSYDGWILFRPAIEAALIMGKWVDDTENAAIWSAREIRKTEYIKNFSGKGLVSRALPRAADLKVVLDRLNDEFVHANEPYYHRHTSVQDAGPGHVNVRVEFFDSKDDGEVHVVAFLHFVAIIADAIDEMLATALPSTGPHIAAAPQLRSELRDRVDRLRSSSPEAGAVLDRLSMWPTDHASAGAPAV